MSNFLNNTTDLEKILDTLNNGKYVDTAGGTAKASDILSGAAAYVNGTKITGTMTNQGAKISSLNCGDSYTISAGYHNGSGKVTANSLSSQTSATASASDLLSGKTAYANGVLITGTLVPAQGALSKTTGSVYLQKSTNANIPISDNCIVYAYCTSESTKMPIYALILNGTLTMWQFPIALDGTYSKSGSNLVVKATTGNFTYAYEIYKAV